MASAGRPAHSFREECVTGTSVSAACSPRVGRSPRRAPCDGIPEKVRMPDQEAGLSDPTRQRQKALSRWDNEGGANALGPQEGMSAGEGITDHAPDVTNAELVLLRVRLIAMENLLIALLADATERQLELTREITAYISPRLGFTHHPLTIRAAAHMSDLVERARLFRSSHAGAAAPSEVGDSHIEAGSVANEPENKRPAPWRHPDDR